MIFFILPILMGIAGLLGLVVFAAAFVFIRQKPKMINRFGAEPTTHNPFGAIVSGFKRIFDFQGRAGRADFWVFAALVVVLSIFALFAPIGTVALTVTIPADNPSTAVTSAPMTWALVGLMLSGILLMVLALASLSMAVRRLHDVNRSGWWLSLLLVFGYFILLYWFAQPSQTDDQVDVF